MGEPLRWYKVLTAARGRVHITPLCSSSIHGLAVALYGPRGVTEAQVGALATTVGEGGGTLCLLQRQTGGAKYQGDENASLGQHDGFMMNSIGRQQCSGSSVDLCGLYGGWERKSRPDGISFLLEMCEHGL